MNGIQEVSGSIPLISTRKSPEIVRFQDFFFIFAPKSVQYINFIPERVPELYQNRVWKRWTQWDAFHALLRPYQLREALDCGGFDTALDVEIVLCHVYLRVTGKGLYCLHRHALRLKLAHEGVAARVRRERPDAGDGLNRGGELVAEVCWVAWLMPETKPNGLCKRKPKLKPSEAGSIWKGGATK